jgi:hypothetical protein
MNFVHGHNTRRLAPGYVIRECGFETPCWVWTGTCDRKGYGLLGKASGVRTAYRKFYEDRYGPTPGHLHHRCENPPCVNPEHLESLSKGEHSRRHRKLTRSQIEAVRTSNEPQRAIAALFGISKTQVGRIRRGESCTDVTEQDSPQIASHVASVSR